MILSIILMPKIILADEKVLTLKEVLDEALEYNPMWRAQRFEVQSKKAAMGPSGSYDDPMVAFAAKDYPVDTFDRKRHGMTGNEISLTQKIPFPGKLTKLRAAAEKEYHSQQKQYEQLKWNLIRDIKLAYYELFLALKKQALLKEQKNFIKQLIVVSRNKYTVGRLSQAELLSFQVEEAKLIGDLLSNEKEIASRKSGLKTFLGKSKLVLNTPALEEIRKTALDFGKIQPDILEKKGVQKNRMLLALEAALDSSKQKLSYAKLGYLPDFEVMAGYTIREPKPADDGVDLFTGKVGLTLPIWALSKQSEQIKGAKAEKAKMEALLESSQIELNNRIQTLHAELFEADQQLKLLETGTLPLSRQAVLSGKSAYLTGKLEYLNLLNFIQNRYQTEIAYFEALIKHESKIAEIESLIVEEIGGGL